MREIIATILSKKDINLPQPNATPDTITHILNIVLSIMGALALFMLVLAGFRYTISQGDATRVADAKRMMAYTIVGLIVILLAAAIVNFVIGRT